MGAFKHFKGALRKFVTNVCAKFCTKLFLRPAFRCHAISNRCCRSGTTPISSLESQLTVDEHHTLRSTLQPTPRTANCTSRSCGNVAQILRKLWTFFRNLVLLRQRRLRKFCGNLAEIHWNVRKIFGERSECKSHFEMHAAVRTSEIPKRGRSRRGRCAIFCANFAQVLLLRRFERKGAQNCVQICTQIGNQFRTNLCKYPFPHAPSWNFWRLSRTPLPLNWRPGWVGGVKSPKIRREWNFEFQGRLKFTPFYRDSLDNGQFGCQKSKSSRGNSRGEFPPF